MHLQGEFSRFIEKIVFFCIVDRGVTPSYTLSGPTTKKKHFFLSVSSLSLIGKSQNQYCQFHKTLPKSSLQMHCISARFYEMVDITVHNYWPIIICYCQFFLCPFYKDISRFFFNNRYFKFNKCWFNLKNKQTTILFCFVKCSKHIFHMSTLFVSCCVI